MRTSLLESLGLSGKKVQGGHLGDPILAVRTPKEWSFLRQFSDTSGSWRSCWSISETGGGWRFEPKKTGLFYWQTFLTWVQNLGLKNWLFWQTGLEKWLTKLIWRTAAIWILGAGNPCRTGGHAAEESIATSYIDSPSFASHVFFRCIVFHLSALVFSVFLLSLSSPWHWRCFLLKFIIHFSSYVFVREWW